MKQQSKQWLPKGSRPPKKDKVVLSAKKIMTTVFFDNQGVVYTTYTSNTINSAAYIESVKECNHKLARKRPFIMTTLVCISPMPRPTS
ncbi:Mariner transposase [Caligus rogercresseyi]|uniref:Mariner transposase n=1 Tax=Caligus rogercresseyi TaxID=217165 RepID=A0A7T8GSN2_CALRO|nr:Mariner transposase [Caligus rogercresseyi]